MFEDGSFDKRREARGLFSAVFAVSVIAHGVLASRLASGATAPPPRAPSTHVDIEFAHPQIEPPPPPVLEPAPESPPPRADPTPKAPRPQVARPSEPTVPRNPSATTESALPSSEEGTLPPATAGTAPPNTSSAVAAAVAPPPPPPAPTAPLPVIEAKEGANYLKNPRPAYPKLALREGWEGKVLLRVKVLADGRVGDATVQKSSGRTLLDDAALAVVHGWSFVPAKLGTQAIVGWVTVPIEFRIND